MTDEQRATIAGIARAKGMSFSAAADWYLQYGTGELAQRENERAEWNAEVDRRKALKNQRKVAVVL